MTTSHSRRVFFSHLAHSSCLTHRVFQTAKVGSLVDIQDSEDPEGLRVFYYLVQDLKVRAFYYTCPYHSSSYIVFHLFAHLLALQDQAYLNQKIWYSARWMVDAVFAPGFWHLTEVMFHKKVCLLLKQTIQITKHI